MKKKIVFNLIILVLISTLSSIDQTFTIDQPTLTGIRDAALSSTSEPFIHYLWNESQDSREYTPEEIQLLGNRYYADYFNFEDMALNAFKGIVDTVSFGNQMSAAIDSILAFNVANFTISIFDPVADSAGYYAIHDTLPSWGSNGKYNGNLTPYRRGRHLSYGLNFFAFAVDMAYYYMDAPQRDIALAKIDSLATWTYDNILDPINWSNGRWSFDVGWCEIEHSQNTGVMPKIGSQSSNRLLLSSGMGYCYLVASSYDELDDIVRQQFKSDTPYPENTSFFGLNDYYVTKSGMYTGGITYQSRALYLSPLFFTALNRKRGINLYDENNEWNCDLVSKMVKQTLRRIDPQFHHLNQEDDWRKQDHSIEIEHCLIPYYYNSDESITNQDIEWYITKLRVKINGYPSQWFEHDQSNQFVAVMGYNYNRNLTVNHSIPELLANVNYSDGELSVLRPELTTLDFNSDGNITTPQLFVNHENSITTYHPDDDKTHFQLYYGGEYFIIDTGYMPWLSPFGRGLDWHSSAYSKNRIIINPDSSETYENAGGGVVVGEYKDLEEVWYYPNSTNTTINYKGPRSYYGISEYNQEIDPANKLYLLENENFSHLKIHVTDPNPEGRFDSGIENPCDVYRNFYMIDNNYYIIYDEIVNQSNHENKYRNQIHLNNTDDPNVSIIIDPNNIGCDNMFTEDINGKFLHGILGAVNEFTTYFDDQNMPLGWVPDTITGNSVIDWDYHSRLRITSKYEMEDAKFLTLLIPSEDSNNPINNNIISGSGYYGVRYDLDINDSYETYTAVMSPSIGSIYFGDGEPFIQTDADFFVFETNNDITDINKLIINGGNNFTVNAYDEIFSSDEIFEEMLSCYEEDSLVVTFKTEFNNHLKYKIYRSVVEPQNFRACSYFDTYLNGTQPNQRYYFEHVQSLAYDEDHFYVNYSYADLATEHLLTEELTIYKGIFDNIEIAGTSKFGTGEIEFRNEITIPAGTEMKFTPGSYPIMTEDTKFVVNGQVTAIGDSLNIIEFDKKLLANWEGFYINTIGSVDFQYCKFTGAERPIISFGSINLENSEITNCNYGLHITSPSSYEISDNLISDCNIYGVFIGNYSLLFTDSSFMGNKISNCQYGIFLLNTNTVIDSNYINSNSLNGLFVSHRSHPIIKRCLIDSTRDGNNDNPEIYLINDSYPVLDYQYNDIIIESGGSSKSIYNANKEIDETPYYCRMNFWGEEITLTEISQSFYPSEWEVIFQPICDSSNTGFTPPFGGGGRLFDEGLEAEIDGDLLLAKEKYLLSIEQNPDDVESLWSASRLLNCVDPDIGFGYDEAQQLYEEIMIDSLNTDLYELAKQSAINCDRKMENFQEAILQYETMFEDSLSIIDSIFTQLDIVYTYMEAEATGNRASGLSFISEDHAVKNSKHAREMENELLSLLMQETDDGGVYSPIIEKVILQGNYPNPFNPTTKISFSIPDESKVKLTVYNIKGQKVRTLVNDQLESGLHDVIWNGRNDHNRSVASGVYLYKLNVNGKDYSVKKCLMLK